MSDSASDSLGTRLDNVSPTDAACEDAIASRRTTAVTLGVPGLLLLFAGGVVNTRQRLALERTAT